MGNIPAPYLTAIIGAEALVAEVTNKFTDSYGDNVVPFSAAMTKMLAGLADVAPYAETAVGDGNSTWEADDEVITEASHGLAVNDLVRIAVDSGATGASAGFYWVVSVPSSSTFTVSATRGGAAQAISADGVVDVFKVTDPAAVQLAQAAYDYVSDLLTPTALGLVTG